MKINKEYLKEFCKHYNIFPNPPRTMQKMKISYNFGVPIENLEKVKTLSELEDRINNFAVIPSESDIDIEDEVISIYNQFVN